MTSFLETILQNWFTKEISLVLSSCRIVTITFFFVFSFSWFGSIFLWAQWRSCRYIRRLEDVLCTFNLRPLSRGKVKKIFPKLVVKFLLHTSSISNWKTNNRKHKTLAHRHCLLEWWSLRLGFSLCHFLSPFLINSSP